MTRTRALWRVLALARFVLLLLMVSIATFLLLELIPGDPVDGLLPPGATDDVRDEVRAAYGLDKPLLDRYFSWLGGVFQGDFGRSLVTRASVADTIAERAPVSAELAVLAMALALAISVPVGVYTAYRPNGAVDTVATFLTSASMAIPSFVLGLLLIWIFGMELGMFPLAGWVPFAEDPVEHVRSIALPVITMAATECVLFIRLLKGDMMATLKQDNVLAARARGLPTWRILVRHALRQSSFSLVTVSGVVIGRLIGGAVIVESLFSLPGLGSLVVNAILTRDFVVVQAVVLLVAVVYLTLNTLVDLAYPLLDPRVRKVAR